MTLEERFEEWKSKQYKDQSTEEKLEFVEHLHYFPKYFEKAYLAGAKENGIIWHDLRKDPNDTPLTEKEVMVFIEWKNNENETAYAYDLGTRHFNGDWCLDVFSSEDKDVKVIAWYDFPQFEGVAE